ncbi:HIT family protein [Hamadaea tsunoensis]|uniref:HIT family protein n=1 Tax=Hamadaea tsunoensis TaxID=53368 RepID=UPI000687B372|nr:HIT family protein [Hamadaea tsunoensis]
MAHRSVPFDRVPFDVAAYAQRSRTSPCFVCAIVDGTPGGEHEVFYDDGEFLGFLSRYPTVPGYCLVAPRAHVEHIVRELSAAAYLRLQAAVYRVARAVEATVPSERTYIASLGSQQANRHLHVHVVPLPPGTPPDEQQFHAMMAEYGVIEQPAEEKERLARELRAAIAREADL